MHCKREVVNALHAGEGLPTLCVDDRASSRAQPGRCAPPPTSALLLFVLRQVLGDVQVVGKVLLPASHLVRDLGVKEFTSGVKEFTISSSVASSHSDNIETREKNLG